MGVKGLHKFLTSYKLKYEEKSVFHSQILLIDGSNLMYFLFFKHNGNYGDHLFGGNFNSYAAEIRTFFDQLDKSMIQPIVIFDGATEKEKVNTVLKSFRDWLLKSYKADVDHIVARNMQHSVWKSAIMHDVLRELNIPQFQTLWEADDTIALAAKELNCAILSSDSDFHVYYNGLKVVDIESFSHRGLASSQNWRDSTPTGQITGFDACFINSAKIWEAEFGIRDVRLLSLATCLIGNDYEPSTFSTFVAQLEGCDIAETYSQNIKAILVWIGRQDSFNSALAAVIETIEISEREDVNNKVSFVVRSYTGGNAEIEVLQRIQVFLLAKMGTSFNTKKCEDDTIIQKGECPGEQLFQNLTLKEDNSEAVEKTHGSDHLSNHNVEIVADSSSIHLPPWFLDLYATCQLPAGLLKIAYTKTVLLYPQFELDSAPPSQSIAIPFIQYTARIILGEDTIFLITHEGKEVKTISVSTESPIKERCPSLQNMDTISLFAKCDYLFRSLSSNNEEIEFINRHPPQIQLSMGCAFYLVKTLKSLHSVGVAIAVMISSLEQFVSKQLSQGCKKQDDDNWRSSRFRSMAEILSQDCNPRGKTARFFRYFQQAPDCRKDHLFRERYDKWRVYVYTQYKCILYWATMLNKVLQNPLRQGKVPDCYLIYNTTTRIAEMENRFLDFVWENFDTGSSSILQDFVKFVCKIGDVRCNGERSAYTTRSTRGKGFIR